ncbi:hypothetical protein LCI18_014828 [Fusarium solani-melongenae]|uniref:Uncharacterized protein n=1 Tax=Fusarium solani subsp. cucurbitae TaxID=2747967 RepID=A0ACD3ZTL1_FUSSC|nr:hypothetical protein LCI18_014828 [Fusarium solani-melongenae]
MMLFSRRLRQSTWTSSVSLRQPCSSASAEREVRRTTLLLVLRSPPPCVHYPEVQRREAIGLANNTTYGLAAAVHTINVNTSVPFITQKLSSRLPSMGFSFPKESPLLRSSGSVNPSRAGFNYNKEHIFPPTSFGNLAFSQPRSSKKILHLVLQHIS